MTSRRMQSFWLMMFRQKNQGRNVLDFYIYDMIDDVFRAGEMQYVGETQHRLSLLMDKLKCRNILEYCDIADCLL